MKKRHLIQYFGTFTVPVVILVACCALFFAGQMTRVTYTIPTDYEGFLVVEYNCVNGTLPVRSFGSVHIEFEDNGVACISASYESVYPTGISHISSIQTKDGTFVSFVGGGPSRHGGYAMTGASLLIVNQVEPHSTYTFEIFWVGEQQHLSQLLTTNEYMNAEATFFEQQLGLPRNGTTRRTPTTQR
jgi:hypothetical protein